MVAASYWSLLAPAIEMATESKIYGANGEYAFVPVAVGFLIGATFVYGTDVLISTLGIQSPNVLLAMQSVGTKQRRKIIAKLKSDEDLDDNVPFNDVQISGSGKMYTSVESTTIDGISYQKISSRKIPVFLSVGLENGISSRYICYTVQYIHMSIYVYKRQCTLAPLCFVAGIVGFYPGISILLFFAIFVRSDAPISICLKIQLTHKLHVA